MTHALSTFALTDSVNIATNGLLMATFSCLSAVERSLKVAIAKKLLVIFTPESTVVFLKFGRESIMIIFISDLRGQIAEIVAMESRPSLPSYNDQLFTTACLIHLSFDPHRILITGYNRIGSNCETPRAKFSNSRFRDALHEYCMGHLNYCNTELCNGEF